MTLDPTDAKLIAQEIYKLLLPHLPPKPPVRIDLKRLADMSPEEGMAEMAKIGELIHG